jgi:hypothetical protein
MPHLRLILVALAFTAAAAPRLGGASPSAVLVFVADGAAEPPVSERLALERLKAGLEASLNAAPVAALGLTHADPSPPEGSLLRRLEEGEDAWLRSAFDEADDVLRDAVAQGLAHLSAVATDPAAGPRLLAGTVRLVQLAGLSGREVANDPLVLRSLAWWGGTPLSEDEYPPDVCALVKHLAASSARCTGEISWRVAGPLAPGSTLVLGGRRFDLSSPGSAHLPCGSWPARRLDAVGRPSPWEWRVAVTADVPRTVVVSERFEAALTVLGERSLEVRSYPELGDDLDLLAGGHPVRQLRIARGPDGLPSVRDEREPAQPPVRAPEISTIAPAGQTTARWAPWALYGLSTAALITGVALNVVTNGWISDQNAGRGSSFERIRQAEIGAWSCYGIAGATALTGALWQTMNW